MNEQSRLAVHPVDPFDAVDAADLAEAAVRHPSATEVLGFACDDAECMQLAVNQQAARLVFAVGDAFAIARENPRVYVSVGAGDRVPGVNDVEFAERSVAFDLAHRLNLSENLVRSYARQAEVLNGSLPALRDLFIDGAIGTQHVRAAVDNADGLPSAEATARYDQRLAAIAAGTRAGDFARRCRVLRERLCIDTLTERHEEARAKRRTCFEIAPDGMAWASGFVPAVDAARVEARLTAAARRLRGVAGETRTLDQIRADLYVAWLTGDAAGIALGGADVTADPARDRGSATHQGSETHQGSAPDQSSAVDASRVAPVPVPPGVQPFLLIDADGRFAELLGYGPVDPVSAMRALRDAPSFRRVFADPVKPTRLIVDRRRYRPTAEQKRWLRLNFGFNEAARPYVSLDAEIDHVIEWQHGGTTDIGNLVPLRPRLHRLKSVTGIRLDPRPDGGIRVRTPTGYDTDPPPF